MSGLGDVAWAAVEWSLTYLIHSTLLLTLAAILTYRVVRDDAWRETLWRGALLGSIFTATIALAPTIPRIGGSLSLGVSQPDLTLAADGRSAEAAAPPSTTTSQGQLAGREVSPSWGGGARWAETVFAVWLALAILSIGHLARRNLRLIERLKVRDRVEDPRLLGMLAELRRNAGVWRPVRLSVSDSCSTPLVLGLADICVPPRFIVDLGEEEQRAALAHELAHIQRRDPQWQLATGILNAILFFQPLNFLARARLAESAEHLCDDWAVRHTGSALPLGRCLAEIASWTAANPLPRLHGTPAMAEGGSGLLHRIRRITLDAPARTRVGLVPALGVALILVATATVAPAVSASDAAAPVAPRARDAEAVASQVGPEARTGIPQDLLDAVAEHERLAMDDSSARIREEAASQLSDFQHAAAAEALMRLVRRATDPEVRRTAAAQLDEFPTDAVVAVLLEVVFADPEAAVREEAFSTLEDFRFESASAVLGRIAREHPVEAVRLSALSALADGR